MQRSRLRLHRDAKCLVMPAAPTVVKPRPVPVPGDRGLLPSRCAPPARPWADGMPASAQEKPYRSMLACSWQYVKNSSADNRYVASDLHGLNMGAAADRLHTQDARATREAPLIQSKLLVGFDQCMT